MEEIENNCNEHLSLSIGENCMKEKFRIETVVENGYPHCKVTDLSTGKEVHCDFDELNDVMYEFLGV